MSFKFNGAKYDASAASKPKTSLPPAGSIQQVRVISRSQAGQDWAGTVERMSSTGRPMLQIHVAVVGGPADDAWMLDYVILDNEWTPQRLGAILDALGFDTTASHNMTAEMLVGRTGFVRVKHETYKDKPTAKVAYWITRGQYAELGLDAPAKPTETNDDPNGIPF